LEITIIIGKFSGGGLGYQIFLALYFFFFSVIGWQGSVQLEASGKEIGEEDEVSHYYKLFSKRVASVGWCKIHGIIGGAIN